MGGIAGGLDGWNVVVVGLMASGTSGGGGCTARLEWGALLGVRRGRLSRKADEGWVGVVVGGVDGCMDGPDRQRAVYVSVFCAGLLSIVLREFCESSSG